MFLLTILNDYKYFYTYDVLFNTAFSSNDAEY